MKERKLKIPKDFVINDNIGNWVSAKINKIKMSDITTTEDFSISVDNRVVYVRHNNVRQLTTFCKRLKEQIDKGGNKLAKAIT